MSVASFTLAAICLVALALQIGSVAVAAVRVSRTPRTAGLIPPATPVSIIRPVCGLENFIEQTLGSAFRLDHRQVEILFCVASPRDPVIPVVERLIAAHPQVRARLLVENSTASTNPKLNNMMKGWAAASHDLVLMVDSNVLMPRDHIARMFAAWRQDTGLVCSPPVGDLPQSFWAEIECAILNGYQARWQLVADSLGFGFAQGKSMLWHRDFLNKRGGLAALSNEPAEDAAATKLVRASGLRVRLVRLPFLQPLGKRAPMEVWRRQIRWGKLRRDTFVAAFIPEFLAGGLFPILACAGFANLVELPIVTSVVVFTAAWYGAEALLAHAAGWHMRAASIPAWIARDLALPAIWLASWAGNDFEWRGNAMTLASPGPSAEAS